MNKTVKVRVVCRCRPQSGKEKAAMDKVVTTVNPRTNEVCTENEEKRIKKTFSFDKVFGPESTQEQVYQNVVSPVIKEVLKGYNCTIFAYGQTGTGKTFTMEGVEGNEVLQGMIPRAIRELFSFSEVTNKFDNVEVSYLELYNEELRDLLASDQLPLKLCDDGKGSVSVTDLTKIKVFNADEIFSVLSRSTNKRIVASTALNSQSSRSHCIFTIAIQLKEITSSGEELTRNGKLNFVDLAGSENMARAGTGNNISRRKEGQAINLSLFTLGRVITALSGNAPHIPYRESKLTRLLQESLGGKAKTTMIVTVGPCKSALEETLSTLEYGRCATNIRNLPELNQSVSKTNLIRSMNSEIEKLKQELQAARNRYGVYLPQDQYKSMENEISYNSDRIKELEKDLNEKLKNIEDLETSFKKIKEAHAHELQLRQQREEELKESREEHDKEVNLRHQREEELKESREEHDKELSLRQLREEELKESRQEHDKELNLRIKRESELSESRKEHKKELDLRQKREEELKETREELEETKDFLEKTKSDLLIHQKAVENKDQTEEALRRHATDLISKLKQSIDRSELLYAKIQKQAKIIDENRRKTNNFSSYSISQMESLKESAKAFTAEQLKNFEEVTKKAEISRQEYENLLAKINEISKSSADTITEKLVALIQASESVKQHNTDMINSYGETTAKELEAENVQLKKVQENNCAGVETIKSFGEACKEAFNKWVNENNATFDVLQKACAEFANTGKVIESEQIKLCNARIDESKEENVKIEQKIDEILAKQSKMQENMKSIAKLLAENQKLSRGTTQDIGATRKMFNESTNSSTSVLSTVVSNSQKATETIDVYSTTVESHLKAAVEKTQGQFKLSVGSLDKLTESAVGIMAITQKDMDAQQDHVAIIRQSVADFRAKAAAQFGTDAMQTKTSYDEVSSLQGSARSRIGSLAAHADDAELQGGSDEIASLGKMVTELGNKEEEFCEKMEAAYDQHGSDTKNVLSSLKEYTPTGETPMKQKVDFITPSKLPKSKRVADFRDNEYDNDTEPAKKKLAL